MSEATDKKQTPEADDTEIIDAEVLAEEAPPEADKTMRTVPPASKIGGKTGWFTAAVLAAFLGGVYASPYFEAGLVALGLRSAAEPTAQPPSEQTAVDIAPIRAEIDDLKASVLRLQEIMAQQQETAAQSAQIQGQIRKDVDLLAGVQNPAASLTSGADIAGLKAEISRLSADLARLSTLNSEADPAVSQLTGGLALARAENTQLKTRLNAIEDMLQAVEAGALEASPRGRLVLSLSRMKDRALAGLSFAADVTGLRVDISELPALDQQLMGVEIAVLEKAGTGIQPYASLVRDFDPTVAAALRAGEKADGSFLSSLFTSRRTDAGATGDDAIFVKAERLLLARDVAGAVDVLGALEGAVGDATKLWRNEAQDHVDVSRAFDRLISAAAQTGPVAGASGGTR